LIDLSLPSSEEKYYANVNNALFGPFRLSGTVEKESDLISFQGVHDSLQQGSKSYHENNVVHIKSEGKFDYIPEFLDITLAPTTTYPNRITWKAKKAATGALETRTFNFGRVDTGANFTYPDASGDYSHITFIKTSGVSFSMFTVWSSRYTATARVRVRKQDFTLKTSTSANTYFSQTSSGIITTWTLTSSIKVPMTHNEIVNFVEENIAAMAPSTDFASGGTWTTYTSPSFSVETAKGIIDSLSHTLIEDISFPIPDLPYGDLAMEASQKVNANKVNMVAFLRDLRRPQEMIPKLRNLRNLKGNASNYLAINYGLLPTMSDIRTIIEAFTRIKPYIDKNGFKTYNAVSQETSEVGVLTYSLEQRIKIAIEDEDSDFQALAQKIDSMGFALTLQNVWDLIPYSFVLDWFIDIGGFLERCDTRMRLMRLNIRYSTMSRKRISSLLIKPSRTAPISGTLSVVRYQRWTEDHCPEPPLIPSSDTNPLSHWLEGSALIIQRAKLK
jgi:hypothetical protein